MADRTRRRRGAPADPDEGRARRRRRGRPPEPEPRRRRRGGAEQEQPDESTPPAAAEEPQAHEAEPQPEAPQAPTPQPDAAPAPAAEPDDTPTGAPSSTRSTPVATEVTLPQLGESVTEGTITAWLVEVGDSVEADQPLFELSSDKIDTEVPAPTGGVLTEIKVGVDETVDVGTVVAVIGDEGEASGDGGGGEAEGSDAEAETEPEQAEEAEESEKAPAASGDAGGNGEGVLMSPLVRRMVAENDLDVSQLSGSGEGGRITREDVEAAISGGGAAQPAAAEKPKAKDKPAAAPQPERKPTVGGDRTRVEDLSRIRQRIAAKMMESMSSSAQLTTVQEADITRIMTTRARVKDEFKSREGVSLSPFVFLARAAVLAVRNHPKVNAFADWDAGKVTFHEYVNLGIAVDTEKGLLVPNVKGADDLSLAGLARAIKTAADKARGKGKLEMQDIEGGTFTLTNTGSVGVLIDTPILNYPEVAILGVGAAKKRPMVVEDSSGIPAIAIRDMIYFSLTYDHRLIDGADAARFVTEVKEIAETHDWDQEIGY